MTQTELADFADLSKRYIQKIEHGEANITDEVVERLAGIFRCGWQEIVGEIRRSDSLDYGCDGESRQRSGGLFGVR